jgi:glycogen synthase
VKILALTNLYPPHYLGGYELICHTVVRALRARGHGVQVLTSDHHVAAVPKGTPEDPEVERSLRIHGLFGHPWLGVARLRRLEEHNNQVLRTALQRHQPDLVYVWNMGGLSKSMLFTLQRSGIPSVFYLSDHWIARGLSADVWLRWWNRADAPVHHKLGRSLLTAAGVRRRLDSSAPTGPVEQLRFPRIYFCSRALRQLTADAGFDVAHGGVIYCPVDKRYFKLEPPATARRYERLLYVGRLAEDKGVLTALRAMALVKDRFPGSLHIFGTGDAPYVERLRAFVREHALPVRFDSAPLDRMPQVYAEHDGLIFTSEWAEPFALTPLEAMASGLPVIGTTTGGSAELFRHGENGLTYSAGSAEELAGRILDMASDPVLRHRCAITGYHEVRERYAEGVIVDQIEEYLEKSLPVATSRQTVRAV